jgi:hypothetical protein
MTFGKNRFMPNRTLTLYGIASTDLTSFFYVCLFPPLFNDTLIDVIKAVMDAENITNLRDLGRIYEATSLHLARHFSNTSVALGATVFNTTSGSHPNPFLSNVKVEGYLIMPEGSAAIYGFVFNEDTFVREGRILGVCIAIGIVLCFVGWKSVASNFDSSARLRQLSLHSYVCHMGFDVGYAVFIFNSGGLCSQLWPFFGLLLSMSVICYFAVELPLVLDVWRASQSHSEDPEGINLRQIFLHIFLEIALSLFVVCTLSTLIIQAPLITLTVLYSFFIPQIFHSIQVPAKKMKDEVFVILISVSRLFPVWYFTCYKWNILGVHAPLVAVYVTAYVAAQVIVLLLQNRFGGAFCLGENCRPKAFDSHRDVPAGGVVCPICFVEFDEGDSLMGTPCDHAFHSECLSRWMSGKMSYPVCRGALPEIDEAVGP